MSNLSRQTKRDPAGRPYNFMGLGDGVWGRGQGPRPLAPFPKNSYSGCSLTAWASTCSWVRPKRRSRGGRPPGRLDEVLLPEVGPQGLGEIEFGIGRLPEQEVAEAASRRWCGSAGPGRAARRCRGSWRSWRRVDVVGVQAAGRQSPGQGLRAPGRSRCGRRSSGPGSASCRCAVGGDAVVFASSRWTRVRAGRSRLPMA